MSKLKKIICSMLTLVLMISLGIGVKPESVYAASAISGNNTMGTAYNCGSWSSMNSLGTAILYEGEQQSWFRFTVDAGEQIYVRVSSDDEYEGMTVEVRNSTGTTTLDSSSNPNDVIYSTSVTPGLYVNLDNTSSSTGTFYIVVSRGTQFEGDMYFGLSASNRIRTGTATFSFSGTASNAGNSPYSSLGCDSSELVLNLANSTQLPDNAIVTSVTTSGTQSPNQGNVHHMIRPTSSSVWYTSIVSSATSGSYDIDVDNGILAGQIWRFKYNAMATAKSTMKSVKLTIRYQYDLRDTEYRIFTN